MELIAKFLSSVWSIFSRSSLISFTWQWNFLFTKDALYTQCLPDQHGQDVAHARTHLHQPHLPQQCLTRAPRAAQNHPFPCSYSVPSINCKYFWSKAPSVDDLVVKSIKLLCLCYKSQTRSQPWSVTAYCGWCFIFKWWYLNALMQIILNRLIKELLKPNAFNPQQQEIHL